MKTMRTTKKVVPALVMLIISALLLTTASYAWFSMNANVTATGMQVTAKSDNTYLLISSTATTASGIQGENKITVDLAVGTDKLYPSAPALSETEAGYLTVAEGHKITNGTDISTPGVEVTGETTANAFTNWYTANASTSDNSAIATATAKQLAGFDSYVVKKTVYLTVAVGANKSNNLKVTPTFTQKVGGTDITAAKILVTTSDGGFAILESSMNGTAKDISGSNTDLTETTVLTVNLYIFYDGNEDVVFTNNAANLAGATMEVAFNVDAVPGE